MAGRVVRVPVAIAPVNDAPVLKALHLYREEAHPAGRRRFSKALVIPN